MKVVIIGGDAAGLKTAARLRRISPETEITVLEKGDIISYAACGLPYYLSGDVDSFEDLIKTAWGEVKNAEFFKEAKGIDVLTGHEAIRINREKKLVESIELKTGELRNFSYDFLVIATGASPFKLDIPGTELDGVGYFTKPAEAIALRRDLETGKIGKVAIIGAGYIGLELCESFGALWGVEVILIEKEEQVLPVMLDTEMAKVVNRHLVEQGVDVRCNSEASEINLNENGLIVRLLAGDHFEIDRVLIAVGVSPRAELAQSAGLDIGANGGIRIDSTGQTSDKYIFAAGDCTELPHGSSSYLLPLGSIANRMGRVVANNIAGKKDELPLLNGSSVVKVFDKNVAVCGKSVQQMKKKNLDCEEYWGSFTDRAHYYPESSDLHIKIVREENGRLVGIQVIGPGDVVRRADSFAQIMTMADGDPAALLKLEHAYAPPFATAMDPLHHMGAMIETGNNLQLPPDALSDGGEADWTVINLLAPDESSEWERPAIKGKWLDIPYSELRRKAKELSGKEVVFICARGPRSYEAAIMLRSMGIDAKYIAGGIVFR
ncbi:MAG: FAD-dependent oxidoreductase [Candidatus Electryonea clarkiae]|nr:FAD-dependent oxidoreductase [Candidatus Electryonea clarkiae]MDP8285920.1 FAD-dependent oxidoreductase [Candidatus Electryonea clarkiae]